MGTSEGDKVEILGLMGDDYEKKYYQIDRPDAIEIIKIIMEELQLKQKKSGK